VHNGLGKQIAPARVRFLRAANNEDKNEEVGRMVFMSRENLYQELAVGYKDEILRRHIIEDGWRREPITCEKRRTANNHCVEK
jgi:hypothetical protein